MKISIHVGPSKEWWTYLALKSNPVLIASLKSSAVFFDEVHRLPPGAPAFDQFFYVFWDGLMSDALLREAELFLGPGKDLTAVVVGDFSAMAGSAYKIRSLYADGELRFDAPGLSFDGKTASDLLVARAKTWLMPLKNVAQNRNRMGVLVDLLYGKRRIVFCGSYGTIPTVIGHLCQRRGIDVGLFDKYEYYGSDPDQSFSNFQGYVERNGRFLGDLYGRGLIDAAFFASALHLLGREYFVERIRAEGMEIFANGYATGLNVNVYTTPFYRQHVFVDFGSVVGTGNYPRLADLVYFRKKTVRVSFEDDLPGLFSHATGGLLNQWLDDLWLLYSPILKQALQTGDLRKQPG